MRVHSINGTVWITGNSRRGLSAFGRYAQRVGLFRAKREIRPFAARYVLDIQATTGLLHVCAHTDAPAAAIAFRQYAAA